jgi:hypothetical protein
VAVIQGNRKMQRAIVELMKQHWRSTVTIGNCFSITLVIPTGSGAFHLGKELKISTISAIVIGSSCSSASARKFDSRSTSSGTK